MSSKHRQNEATIVVALREGSFQLESAPPGTRVLIHVYTGDISSSVPSEVIALTVSPARS